MWVSYYSLCIHKASDSFFHPFYISVTGAIRLQMFRVRELFREQLQPGNPSSSSSHRRGLQNTGM